MSTAAAAIDLDTVMAPMAIAPRPKGRRTAFLSVGGLLILDPTSGAAPNVPLADGYTLPLESSSGESPWRAVQAQDETERDRATLPDAQGRDAIHEVRRLAGLTWEQTARLFGVSRRSVHLWASGEAISPSRLERVRRALAVLKAVDRGSAAQNCSILFEPSSDGSVPFDDLVAEQWQAAFDKLGVGSGRLATVRRPLSAEDRVARKPSPPAELVDALHDRVHREGQRSRAARAGRAGK